MRPTVPGLGSVALALVTVAVAELGAPPMVWITVLVVGLALAVWAVILMVREKDRKDQKELPQRIGVVSHNQHGGITLKPHLTLSIGGAIISGLPSGMRVQLTASILNRGSPTTLCNWQLQVQSATLTEEAIHLVGDQPIEGSVDLEPLATTLGNKPLRREIHGLLYFRLSQMTKDQIFGEIDAGRSVMFRLAVTDDENVVWTTKKDLRDLANEQRTDL